VLSKVGITLVSTVGGASGPLYGTLFMRMGASLGDTEAATPAQLAAALRERLAIIADGASRENPQQHVAKLKSVSEKIARLEKKLAQPVAPRLAHFLARCSYDKALDLLEGRAPSRP